MMFTGNSEYDQVTFEVIFPPVCDVCSLPFSTWRGEVLRG